MARLIPEETVKFYSDKNIKLLTLHRHLATATLGFQCDLCGHEWSEKHSQSPVCPECGGVKKDDEDKKKKTPKRRLLGK